MLTTERKIEAASEAVLDEKRTEGPALRLELREDGRVWALSPDGDRPVRFRQCFPWSAPGEYITVRDLDDKEVALIENLDALDADSRRAAEAALNEAGFVFEVIGVDEIDDHFEIRHWRVRTRQGERWFQTERNEWPRAMPDGGVQVRDVAGDLYIIRDPKGLDASSRRILWPYID